MKRVILIMVVFALTATLAAAQASEGVVELYNAVYRGDVHEAERLMSNPVDPNAILAFGSDYTTPLLAAVWADRPEMVRLLIEMGADPSLADSSGRTPLFLVATCGSCDALRELIAAGCDPYSCDPRTGLTVAETADLAGNREVARYVAGRR
jgi:hypothetical protein